MFFQNIAEVGMKPGRVMIFGPQNLGPYHYARFAALGPLVEDFVYVRVPYREYVRPWKVDETGFPGHLLTYAGDFRRLIEKWRPSLVVTVGLFHPVFWGVAALAKQWGIRVVARLEGHALGRDMQNPKEDFKRWLLGHLYTGVSLWGKLPLEYARLLGVPEERIFHVPMVVDNEHFAGAPRTELREIRNFGPFFLTVARIHPKKNLHRLLLAFERYRAAGGTWNLALVGGRPRREWIEKWLSPVCRRYVVALGWQQYEALPGLYARCAAFVLPSIDETWGLAVNEALAAGKPVLVSRLCGCAPDLCQHGYNGFQFDPFDVQSISDALLRMERLDPDERRLYGVRGQALVSHLTPNEWARAMAALAEP